MTVTAIIVLSAVNYAADDGAALHFIGQEFVGAVSSRQGARAYRVALHHAQVLEDELPTVSSAIEARAPTRRYEPGLSNSGLKLTKPRFARLLQLKPDTLCGRGEGKDLSVVATGEVVSRVRATGEHLHRWHGVPLRWFRLRVLRGCPPKGRRPVPSCLSAGHASPLRLLALAVVSAVARSQGHLHLWHPERSFLAVMATVP